MYRIPLLAGKAVVLGVSLASMRLRKKLLGEVSPGTSYFRVVDVRNMTQPTRNT